MLTWLHFWEHSAISLYLNAIGFADDFVSGYFLKIIFLDTKAMKFGDVGSGKISIAAYEIFYEKLNYRKMSKGESFFILSPTFFS